MVQPQTLLKVLDNSGASIVKCFNTLYKPSPSTGRHKHKRQSATLGDLIVCSVKETKPLLPSQSNAKVEKVEKGQVVHAMVVRERRNFIRPDGTMIRTDDAGCVLVNLDKKKRGRDGWITPKGTRMNGMVCEEIRKKSVPKILSLAPQSI